MESYAKCPAYVNNRLRRVHANGSVFLPQHSDTPFRNGRSRTWFKLLQRSFAFHPTPPQEGEGTGTLASLTSK